MMGVSDSLHLCTLAGIAQQHLSGDPKEAATHACRCVCHPKQTDNPHASTVFVLMRPYIIALSTITFPTMKG